MATKVHHWKHGWIPLDAYARDQLAHRAGRGKVSRPHPVVVHKAKAARMPDLQKEIEANGGFTYDPKTNGLLKVGQAKGFAVAVPGTEQTVGKESVSRDDFAKGVAKVIRQHSAAIGKGAVIGGWYSPDRGEYMVELTEIHPPDDRAAAIRAGIARNQEAIFDLATGETINTGGTGDAGLKQKAG